jgi:hypothetical protein
MPQAAPAPQPNPAAPQAPGSDFADPFEQFRKNRG